MVGLNTWHRSARRPPQPVDCVWVPPLFCGRSSDDLSFHCSLNGPNDGLVASRLHSEPDTFPQLSVSFAFSKSFSLQRHVENLFPENRWKSFGVLPSDVVECGSSALVHQVTALSHEPWYDRVRHLNVKPRLPFQIVLERPELFLKALDGILHFSVWLRFSKRQRNFDGGSELSMADSDCECLEVDCERTTGG